MARLARLSHFVFALPILVSVSSAQVRVACIGDSITYGARIDDRDDLSYPARLQLRLGDGYEVRNFGLNGRTLRAGADLPYVEEQAFHDAIRWQPDVAVILLGTNDTALSAERPNWVQGHDFSGDVQALTDPLRQSNPDLRVLLATSPKIADDLLGLEAAVVEDMRARIPRLAVVRSQMRRIARANESFEFVELSRRLDTVHYVDGYHPNARGADHLAVRFTTAIQSQLVRRKKFRSGIEKVTAKFGKLAEGAFGELETLTFDFEGHGNAKITLIQPERPLEGLPWVYFPGKVAAASTWPLELADRGFHVVLADSDRPWTTLPIELSTLLQGAGFAEGIDGRRIMEVGNPDAIARAALRLFGASSDEAYPATTARSGVALGPAHDFGPADTWESISFLLDYMARRIRHVDALFIGGTSIQDLTGHIHRAAQPGRGRAFDVLAGPRRAASFGISGERTEHLLWRINRGTFDPTTPATIVIQIGGHNIIEARHSVQETMDGIVRVVEALRLRYPSTKVVLCTPLPANAPVDSYVHHAVASLRSELLRYKFGVAVHMADTGIAFANPDGSLKASLSTDGLTMTPAGRRAFLDVVRPVLNPLLALEPLEPLPPLSAADILAPSF